MKYGPVSSYSFQEYKDTTLELGYTREFKSSLEVHCRFNVSEAQASIPGVIEDAELRAKSGLMEYLYSDVITELYVIASMLNDGTREGIYNAECSIHKLISELRSPQ